MSSVSLFAQVILGPAGSGKSTYCHTIKTMAETLKRNIITVNLDPAAEYLPYSPDIDIRDLITLKDVMEEFGLGPNGGLVYCFEFLLQEIDWLETQLNDHTISGDYLLIDCPGQLELYMHLDVFPGVLEFLSSMNVALCTVCLVDSTFCLDLMKFYGGVLMALAMMLNLPYASLTVLSKSDLVTDKTRLHSFLCVEPEIGVGTEDAKSEDYFLQKYGGLYRAIKGLVGLTRWVTTTWCPSANWTSKTGRPCWSSFDKQTRASSSKTRGNPTVAHSNKPSSSSTNSTSNPIHTN